MKRSNKAKRLVCRPEFRQRVVRDRTKYKRKSKHKKAPDSGGFVLCPIPASDHQVDLLHSADTAVLLHKDSAGSHLAQLLVG